jgi:hypothetical protein
MKCFSLLCIKRSRIRIWISENGDEVRGDVEKYNQRGFTGGKYLCIVEYDGSVGENLE